MQEPTFHAVKPRQSTRVTMRITGPPGVGKSHLAVESTPPVFVFDMSDALGDIVSHVANKQLSHTTYQSDGALLTASSIKNTIERFRKEWTWATTALESGTIVIDDITKLKQLFELDKQNEILSDPKRMDKEIGPWDFTAVNQDWENLLDMMTNSQCNFIFIARSKPRYYNDSWDGVSYDADEPKPLSSTVQVCCDLRLQMSENNTLHRYLRITKSRFNPQLVGQEFGDDDATFNTLLQLFGENVKKQKVVT